MIRAVLGAVVAEAQAVAAEWVPGWVESAQGIPTVLLFLAAGRGPA
jgi:hypothetical protein